MNTPPSVAAKIDSSMRAGSRKPSLGVQTCHQYGSSPPFAGLASFTAAGALASAMPRTCLRIASTSRPPEASRDSAA